MKRTLLFIVLYAGACAALFTQDAGSSESKTYNIGDVGPAGGIVFYDKGFYSNDWRYLEAAPVETEFTAVWGAYGVNIIGTGPALGSGKGNTSIIVERLGTLGESGCAAQLCARMNFSGFSDWFLPSKDELDLMYKNLKQKNAGEFGTKISYWSSTQANNESAWYQNFGNGRQFNYGNYKYNAFLVRAIRSF
jgi:hypothetical protein